MISSDLIVYSIDGNTKVPLLRSFSLISKLKSGDILIAGHYKVSQTFGYRQVRPLLIQFLHIFLIDTSSENLPFLSVGITRPVLTFKRASNIQFQQKRRFTMVASRQVQFPFYTDFDRERGRGSVHLHKILGEPH